MVNILRILIVLACFLAAAVPAHAHDDHPLSNHKNLGDDSIFDVPRDVPGDLDASLHGAPDAVAPSSQAGCTTKFLSTNFSSRGGVAPGNNVAHYTVSANQPGTGDVNAIWNFFNRATTKASSNYIIDFEGNCIYAVPEDAKAWTQGAFNPSSISIEFIATGRETRTQWLTAGLPGLKKGAKVFADAAKRHNIPVRLVDPVGCTVTRGITDHNRLECGNTHTDVAPNFPMDRFITLIKEASVPPMEIVHFVIASGEGAGIVKSQGVVTGPREAVRLKEFLAFRNAAILRELRADGDVSILRRKGKP